MSEKAMKRIVAFLDETRVLVNKQAELAMQQAKHAKKHANIVNGLYEAAVKEVKGEYDEEQPQTARPQNG